MSAHPGDVVLVDHREPHLTYAVPCPFCHVQAGSTCITGSRDRRLVHAARRPLTSRGEIPSGAAR